MGTSIKLTKTFLITAELEVVGKAVPRLLSGYQKNRMEEKQILQSLREEGLIAMPKAKATNGLRSVFLYGYKTLRWVYP